MKTTKFEIKTWMSENRQVVIEKYEELTKENFFQGITLKGFMCEVLSAMVINNIKSEKRAIAMLPFLMGNVYFDNSNPSKKRKK